MPSTLIDDCHTYNSASMEQFLAYGDLCQDWASVKMPHLGVGMGAAWIVGVSQETGQFEGPEPGPASMFIIIEIDGYTHS
jgi:hypothetical protein